jgi:anaerobic selenocysteine-containing dehydrogenase
LGSLTGNIGIDGGGVNHGFLTQRHFDPKVLAPEAITYKRQLSEPLIGQEIKESKNPPVKMIWINASNPVISCPNSNKVIEALKGLDFVVVVDQFMTDTAELAHIFLPTTTFFEEEDIVVSWGHNWIGPVNKAIEPLGESKSPVRCPIAPMVAFEDRRFLTPSGKFEFIKHFYEEKRNAFPYYLLSPLSRTWHLSLILEDEHPEIPQVFIHPKLAKEKGILNKTMVCIRRTGCRSGSF